MPDEKLPVIFSTALKVPSKVFFTNVPAPSMTPIPVSKGP